MVLTEHRPDIKSAKYLFPQRNRIVAGLSDALLITEAGARSGTSITKDFALDYGVPIYAVPGNITSPKSDGTNLLISTMQGICTLEPKSIIEDFFILSSGLAGEILQKFINYGGKIAIYGDFSKYTSKPLKDFIYESNKGRDVFFVTTKEEAIQKISKSI